MIERFAGIGLIVGRCPARDAAAVLCIGLKRVDVVDEDLPGDDDVVNAVIV